MLRPGHYRVVAEKSGYRPLEHPIHVTDDSSQAFSMTLERLPGLLSISTGPVTGAVVHLDGGAIGSTPLADAEVKEGRHALRIDSERHLPYASDIDVEGGGVQQRLEIELLPAWADVSIRSRPPGALLRVDGQEVGRTPLVAELLAGVRELELHLDGHKTWRGSLAVAASRPQTLDEVALDPADGRLRLRSQPTQASVAVDGRFRGRTPVELSLAPGRDHVVLVTKLGHTPVERTVALESGEERELELRLAARRGELRVLARPDGSELFVDGVSRGDANQRLELLAVPHVVEVRKRGYAPDRTKVTPRPGFPQVLKVELLTVEQAKLAGFPQRGVTSQGQELQLVEPGTFQMGAPRREQGRRANEVLRTVKLERPFYIGVKEVTNREFRKFAAHHTSGLFERFSLDADEHPVVRVSWEEAARYCNWLSERESLPPVYVSQGGRLLAPQPLATGYRLPTEAEWAWVARYQGGGEPRKYPWGAGLPPAPDSGNFADAEAIDILGNVLTTYDDGYAVSAPVGSFEPNALGVYDVGGNVAEWTHDFYGIHPGSSQAPETDPAGPPDGKYHVIRGSSWRDSSIAELRLSYRDYGDGRRGDLGFRIARYTE
ncbi:MAG: SUMF1/EgtB/PvdO family nonheme iron enzyme [Myxococcales bacterium]|nr:SUMF1/EgtB/PvdO family nonheme iron enzyme [Myxococcales bacterium]